MFFEWVQLFVLIALAIVLTPLLGGYMTRVFTGERTFMHPFVGWLEELSYRVGGIDPDQEMGWKQYLGALLLFNLLGILVLFVILLTQHVLPFNPEKLASLRWDLALNTAISFGTNTNWQAYAGETTMSYGSQMGGLTVQNFLSAATGNAALLALIRGITRKASHTLGNFWVDLVRTIVYLLLPLACLLTVFLVSQGVIQNLKPYVKATTLENQTQTIPLGPAASQVAIKQLGTNGGGFFGSNSAHPFENPNGRSNFVQLLAIILIPVSATYMYGSMVGSKRHGWFLLLAVGAIWALTLGVSCYAEHQKNPALNAQPNMEGKEVRIGVLPSLLWSISTTATASGSVNAMLTSLSPLAGGAALFNMLLGESIMGGVGVGLCSLLVFVFQTMFLSGLMVGRTPEYMGKKIEKREMQWVSLAILTPAALILIGSALSSLYPPALAARLNHGPHGLSELLYTFSSTSANNGSAFGGMSIDNPLFNLWTGACMLIGRLSILIPALAIGGSLVVKKGIPASSGSFSTDTWLFFSLLVGVILIVGALIFFPALCLGPIIEHFLMLKAEVF